MPAKRLFCPFRPLLVSPSRTQSVALRFHVEPLRGNPADDRLRPSQTVITGDTRRIVRPFQTVITDDIRRIVRPSQTVITGDTQRIARPSQTVMTGDAQRIAR